MNQRSMELYRKLYLVRRSEQAIIKYYPENEMKTPMHMSMGQEAIPVAFCQAIGPEGQVFGSYRSHALFLAKTEDPHEFFGELYGRETGSAQGKAGSMHLASHRRGHVMSSAIVASSIPLAVGSAFAHKRQESGRIACVFFGDGAVDEGNFWESLNVASVMKLPVIFVCEDNNFAVHTEPHIRQGYRSITDIVGRFNCTAFESESNDVEVLYQLALDAIRSIHATGKPVFFNLKCYRYLEHVGISEDFDVGYRSRTDYEEWLKRDCVKTQRSHLMDIGFSEEDIQQQEAQIDKDIADSISQAKKAPPPKPEALYQGVFYEGN